MEKQEEKKEEKKQEENNENIDDLDACLDEFDDENKLDVTASEKDPKEENDFDPQTDKEFQEFMKQMQQGMGLEGGEGGMGGAEGMQGMEQMMQGLLGGMAGGMGGGQQDSKQEGGANFENMFKNMDNNPNLDNLADHLLKEFMDKDILLEPLKDASENYTKFLQENDDKLSEEEKLKYVNQLSCIDDILKIIETEGNNKEAMIKKFEEMQEYGPPPEALMNAFGKDSPFAMFSQLAGGGGGSGATGQEGGANPFAAFMQQQGGQQQGQGKPGEECIIF